MSLTLSAGRGVTQVVERCEAAKEGGFLDLSSCQLMYIADAVYLLLKGYTISKVSIADNTLKKFPRKFVEKFPEATILNMEQNEISELPEEVGNWKSIKGLNASKNKLSGKFPEILYSLENLIYLDLSDNEISEIDFGKIQTSLPKLVQLNLSNNSLPEDLKDIVKSFEKLKVLL
ncbi:unnamed protein product [Caenorhabditis angaria]|uniref:Uncharacterized protein n=1 Tax=Caenorhabditis angaria TaxID=860376 RepID=A0A9P1IRM5_9PELO|nr:unnamed protein product [Caenorhabditis angaria]